MEGLTGKMKKDIVSALRARSVGLGCPRCGHFNFTLADGYFNQTIQTELEGIVVGGPSIPSVVTICDNCGFISQHALGALGLLPEKEKKP